MLKSKTADGRCVPWGGTLSQWDMETWKIQRYEYGLAAILGTGIIPRVYLDEIAESLISAMGRVKAPPVGSVGLLGEDCSELR